MLQYSLVFCLLRSSFFVYNIQNLCLLWIFICSFPNLNKADHDSDKKQEKDQFSSPCETHTLCGTCKHSKSIGNSNKSSSNNPKKTEIEHRFAFPKTKEIHNKALETNIHIPAKKEKHTWENHDHWLEIRFTQKPNRLNSSPLHIANLYKRKKHERYCKYKKEKGKKFLIFGIISKFMSMFLKFLFEHLHILVWHRGSRKGIKIQILLI